MAAAAQHRPAYHQLLLSFLHAFAPLPTPPRAAPAAASPTKAATPTAAAAAAAAAAASVILVILPRKPARRELLVRGDLKPRAAREESSIT